MQQIFQAQFQAMWVSPISRIEKIQSIILLVYVKLSALLEYDCAVTGAVECE